jgi:cell division protein FtsQ
MPVEMADPDDDAPRRTRPKNPWWRPSGVVGRWLLAAGAVLVLSSLIASGVMLKKYLGRDSRFRIAGAGNVQAAGLAQVTRADLLPVFGEDIGRNIFFVPLSERRKQLEQIPWVQSATVMRLLPDQLRVNIVERQPVAFVRQGQHIGLVDASGILLSMPAAAMAQHHYSFPVVTGIDSGDTAASRKERMAVYERMIGELDANKQNLSDQISEIDLTDPEDARILMPEQGADILAHMGDDHFLDRYQRYKTHIAEWRQQYPKLAAVDLRYDEQVVLKMSGPDATQATIGNATAATKPAASAPATLQSVSAETKPTPSQPVKTAAKPKAKAPTSNVKALTAKDKAAKAARERKKRADAKRAAALKAKQKKQPTATHSTASNDQGQ